MGLFLNYNWYHSSFKKRGMSIGSGSIESGHKNVVQKIQSKVDKRGGATSGGQLAS